MPEAEGNTWTVLTKHTSLTAPLGMLTICKLGIAASRLYASFDAQPRQHAKNRGFRKDLDEPEHGSCVSLLALPQLPAMFLVPGLWEARNCLQIWHLLQHVGWGSSKAACCSSPSNISKKWQQRRAPQKPGTMFLLEFLFARFCGPGKEKLLKCTEPCQFLYPDCSRFLPSSFRTQNLKAMMYHVSQYYIDIYVKYDWWTQAGTHVGFSQSIGLYSLSSQHVFFLGGSPNYYSARLMYIDELIDCMMVRVCSPFIFMFIYIVLPFECYILNFI